MTWADFYLICFAVGFLFSLLSFLAGGMRWHLHPPHFLHGHVAMPHVGGGHGAPAGHAPAHPTSPGQKVAMDQTVNISPFNFITATAFLAWFGGLDISLPVFPVSGLSPGWALL